MSYVFLHGLGQNAQAWDKVQSHFPGAICPDLAQCPDYPSLYQTLSAQLQCVPNPLYLCGLSLGGVLALDFTLKNPDRVRSLVLIGAQYKMPKTLLSLQNAVLRLMGRREMVRMCNSMKHLDFSAELGRISCPVLVVCGDTVTESMKNDIAVAQRLGITATTLEGILTVKGQGRR